METIKYDWFLLAILSSVDPGIAQMCLILCLNLLSFPSSHWHMLFFCLAWYHLFVLKKIHQHLVLCWLYSVIPRKPCKVSFIMKRLNPPGQLKVNSKVSSCWNALTMVHWLPSPWSSSPYFGLIWSLLCVLQILSPRGCRVSCLVEEFKLKEILHNLLWIVGYFRVTLFKSPCKVNMWLLFSSH